MIYRHYKCNTLYLPFPDLCWFNKLLFLIYNYTSGRIMVLVTSGGNLSCLFRSTISIQSFTEARMPEFLDLLMIGADPSLTKLMMVGLVCINGLFFHIASKLATISLMILSCRQRYHPLLSAVLEEERTCFMFADLPRNLRWGHHWRQNVVNRA